MKKTLSFHCVIFWETKLKLKLQSALKVSSKRNKFRLKTCRVIPWKSCISLKSFFLKNDQIARKDFCSIFCTTRLYIILPHLLSISTFKWHKCRAQKKLHLIEFSWNHLQMPLYFWRQNLMTFGKSNLIEACQNSWIGLIKRLLPSVFCKRFQSYFAYILLFLV